MHIRILRQSSQAMTSSFAWGRSLDRAKGRVKPSVSRLDKRGTSFVRAAQALLWTAAMGAGPRALRRFGMGFRAGPRVPRRCGKSRSSRALVPAASESGDAPEYRLSPHSTKYGLRRWARYPAPFAALGWAFRAERGERGVEPRMNANGHEWQGKKMQKGGLSPTSADGSKPTCAGASMVWSATDHAMLLPPCEMHG